MRCSSSWTTHRLPANHVIAKATHVRCRGAGRLQPCLEAFIADAGNDRCDQATFRRAEIDGLAGACRLAADAVQSFFAWAAVGQPRCRAPAEPRSRSRGSARACPVHPPGWPERAPAGASRPSRESAAWSSIRSHQPARWRAPAGRTHEQRAGLALLGAVVGGRCCLCTSSTS